MDTAWKVSKYGGFFWSVFSYIRTEYGDLRSKSPYSVRIQENTEQKKLCIFWKIEKALQIAMGNMEEAKVYEKIVIGSYKEDLLLDDVPGEYLALHESVQIRSFFWSVFSRIWTEYGDLLTYLDTFSRSLVYANPFLNVSETPWLSLSLGKENGFAFSAKFVFETRTAKRKKHFQQ